MAEFIYQQLANRFEAMIREQVLRIGDRLPSVRNLSNQQGVSLSTVYQAYIELEKRGLVEAHPKSGYYVRFSPSALPRLKEQSPQKRDPALATPEDIIATVYEKLGSPEIMPFSMNVPGTALLPLAKLKRSILQVIRSHPSLCVGYEDIRGNSQLRKQIARLAFSSGVTTSPQHIVTTAGCMEAVNFCLRILTRPGDAVAIESPTYFGIWQTIRAMGLQAVEIPTHPDNGVSLKSLEDKLVENSIKVCLLVPNFSNPLGAKMPDDRKEALVDLLAHYQVPLIENDIYGEMYFDRERPKTCKSFDKTGDVLLCSSVSKSLAPGYRVGWVISGKYSSQIAQAKLHQTISTSTLTQEVVANFLQNGRFGLHMRDLRKSLHTQSLRYLKAIEDYFPNSVRVSRPQGGFLFWLELQKGVDTYAIYQDAIARNISVAPGQMFSHDGDYRHFMRLSFGLPYDRQVDAAMKTLGDIIRRHQAEAENR